MSTVASLTEIEYPESDGRPMGETDVHRLWMIRLYDLLSWRYRGRRVYVGSDLLLYYVEGQPRKYVVPDVFVVKDCDPGLRRTFKTWAEGCAPHVVFEVTSRGTRRKDQVTKPKTYGEIGVRELFLYDPLNEYLEPPLQGFRFENRRPIPIAADKPGTLACLELGLTLRLKNGRLEILDASSGAQLLTEAEAERAAKEAERSAREAAEAEVRRLREEISRRAGNGGRST